MVGNSFVFRRPLLTATGLIASALLTTFAIGGPAWANPVWSLSTSPNSGTDFNYLNGVSCVSATSCKAVGAIFPITSGGPQTLIESWNGSNWTIQSSPDNETGDVLNGVSCVSATSCKAVGYYENGILIESWNGSKWTIQSSPNLGSVTNEQLSAVSCASAASCKAVGSYFKAAYGLNFETSLIESWNGSSWTIQSSPDAVNKVLNGVSCVSATSCKAVGDYLSGNFEKTLVESWNGSSWTVQSSPNTLADNRLGGVSCVSASSCKAVGSSVSPGHGGGTLVESWNGSSWTVQSSPNTLADSGLGSVSCISINSCKAVGSSDDSSGYYRTLIESWTAGYGWSISPSPDNGSYSNLLNGVSCVSASSCQAAGDYVIASGAYQTLIETY